MTLVRVAALAHLLCSMAVMGFQLALAFGAPLGAYAMGGRYGDRKSTRLNSSHT